MISSARTSRLVALAATTVLGLSVAAAPASAESRTIKDGKGDTWNVNVEPPEKEGGQPQADLRKLVVKHTDRKVVVTARTQNLKKTGNGVGITMNIVTDDDASYGASVTGRPGAWGGEADFYASDGTCDAVKGSMNYRKDVMTVSIPRRCLNRPQWVKVQLYGLYAPNENKYLVDNAMTAKLDGGFTRRIEKG